MISYKIKYLAYFLLSLLLVTPVYADVLVTEKGDLGDLRWWSDQVVASGNTIYILGYKKNPPDEINYKLYTVNTKTGEKSDVVLTWKDGSPVQVPQNAVGFLDSSNILLHWWEPGYYSNGTGAEVTGALNIGSGTVTKWQADPAPAHDASPQNKVGIIADLRTLYINGSYIRDGNFLLKQGFDKDGNAKLYRYNTSSRITEAADISQQYSSIIGFNASDGSMHVLWPAKLPDNSDICRYGNMLINGAVQNINTFPELKAFQRSAQYGDIIRLNGLNFSGQKRLYKYNTATGTTTSSPFADQSIQYDVYAINADGEIITLWWDAGEQKQKYGVIANNSTVTLSGGTIVNEDVGTVILTATLANPSSETVTVNLASNEAGGDTAVNPDDYNSDASIIIAAGSTTGTGTVTIQNDAVHEPGGSEFLTISVSEVHSAEETGIQIVTITIIETDNDGDGLPDDWETENNAYDPDADPDNEGLTNLEEYQHDTDPNDPDSDDDGYSDKTEVLYGTDPNDPDTETPDPLVIYVNKNAQGIASGKSWGSACTEFYQAVALFRFLLPGAQVWVAAGTYYPDTEGLANPREAAFTMRNGVTVYGGFSGTETSFAERDPVANKSILSGDIGVQADDSDNSYHVFYHPKGLNIDETAVLNGVIITGGNADGNDQDSLGGGIYNQECSPTLSQVVFINNKAEYGGGLYNINSEPLLTGCVFKENFATDSGGGIGNDFSFLRLLNCVFYGNYSNNLGGAIDADESDIEIRGCTFTENIAGYHGGGFFGTATYLTIVGSIFWNNAPDEIKTLDGVDIIKYSNIRGAQQQDGNIDANPLFTDRRHNDFSLMADSPCINTGDTAATEEIYGQTDLAGNPRISDRRIDMGAYEYAGSGGNSSSGSGCFINIASRAWFSGWNKK